MQVQVQVQVQVRVRVRVQVRVQVQVRVRVQAQVQALLLLHDSVLQTANVKHTLEKHVCDTSHHINIKKWHYIRFHQLWHDFEYLMTTATTE